VTKKIRAVRDQTGGEKILAWSFARFDLSVASSFLAAWVAAGASGLLAHGLRHALTWLLLVVAGIAGWPATRLREGQKWGFAAMLAAAAAMTVPSSFILNVLAVPLFMATLAAVQRGFGRRVFECAMGALATYALYRFLVGSFSLVWVFSDRAAALLGSVASRLMGRKLAVGPTFAGLDFLVLALAWYALWLAKTQRPRGVAAGWGAAGICVAHSAYLYIVVHAADLASAVPASGGEQQEWWLAWIRHAVPWNLPSLGAIFHALAVLLMVRWARWEQAEITEIPALKPVASPYRNRRKRVWLLCGALGAATVLGLLASLVWGKPAIDGRKIVFYEKGFLNWLKPKHGEYGRLSIGMYGMLPHFVRSLGAECVISSELCDEDLREADAVVLIYPDKPWEPGQLERLWRYVSEGGALWVLGEHTVREADGTARFNEVLAPTGIRVQFDSATFTIGGWLQSFETLAHPTTIGIPDGRNELGIVIGASLETRWPARPLVMGRWGWSDWGDPGSSVAMMGNRRYDAGERLGDLILVAEQRLGKGRVLVFGDTSSLSNGINMGSSLFTSRVFAYLADRRMTDLQSWWRTVMAVFLALTLVVWVTSRATSLQVALAIAVLALAWAGGRAVTYRRMEIAPRSDRDPEIDLAYIDESHLGLFSAESWRDDGLMGLALNLMRNGYLTLLMHKFSAERLANADLFVSVAPAREYSASERQALLKFVEKGGIFILTVGYDERGPAESLLHALGFEVGGAEGGHGARPLGFFKSPYINTGRGLAYVRFYAAWPVSSEYEDAQVIAYGPGDVPVIMRRRIGKGSVVVVGDSSFAMNKNLEVESGCPFEGMRENPNFWRWLLNYLRGGGIWIPPPSDARAAPDAAEEMEP